MITSRESRREELEKELARLEGLRARSLAKQHAPETPNRSRFTYAAHVTKLRGRIAQIERRLEELA